MHWTLELPSGERWCHGGLSRALGARLRAQCPHIPALVAAGTGLSELSALAFYNPLSSFLRQAPGETDVPRGAEPPGAGAGDPCQAPGSRLCQPRATTLGVGTRGQNWLFLALRRLAQHTLCSGPGRTPVQPALSATLRPPSDAGLTRSRISVQRKPLSP